MWNWIFLLLFFFNNTFFLHHKSTRLLAHYQLNIIKVVFYSPATHHCSSNWNFWFQVNTEISSTQSKEKKFRFWLPKVAAGGSRLLRQKARWKESISVQLPMGPAHTLQQRGRHSVVGSDPSPRSQGSGKGLGPPWGGWQHTDCRAGEKRGLWAQVIILKAFPHIQ